MNLKKYKIHAHAIHGGLEQKKRTRIIEQFHKNEADILVCTDVAARGLDIKGVTHVYNYDSSKTSEEYIHRIGRTARAGKKGMAISIVSNRDYENFRNIIQDDSLKITQEDLPKLEILRADFRTERRQTSRNFRNKPSHNKKKSYQGANRHSRRNRY